MSPTPPPKPSDDASSVPDAAIHRFSHEAMSTSFEVVIARFDARRARQAAQEVFNLIDRVEALLTRFEPTSEIARINRLAPGGHLAVSREVFECLMLSRQLYEETGGRFDVSVGPLMRYWRAVHAGERPPDQRALAEARASIGLHRLLFQIAGDRPDLPPADGEPRRCLIGLHPDGPGIDIDLGGIGKGFALDLAIDILANWEIESALLSAGGSTVLAIGDAPAEAGDPAADSAPHGWSLGIGGLWAEAAGEISAVRLRDMAISGSGSEARGAHLLDPRTGHPATGVIHAWSIGPSATVCDALSTAFFLMTADEVEAYCHDHAPFSAFIVYHGPDSEPRIRLFGEFFHS
jgi:thiamine biosynthesis lipoprotein